jgi:hypothetical protein
VSAVSSVLPEYSGSIETKIADMRPEIDIYVLWFLMRTL